MINGITIDYKNDAIERRVFAAANGKHVSEKIQLKGEERSGEKRGFLYRMVRCTYICQRT